MKLREGVHALDGMKWTDRQLNTLLLRWRLGSDDAVAKEMKLSRSTVKNLLYNLRWQINAEDTLQAVYILRDQLMELEARQEMEAKMARLRRTRKAA